MSDLKVRCTRTAKMLLDVKRDSTGRSIPELLEYAVVNMPFIPPKDLNNRKVRGFR